MRRTPILIGCMLSMALVAMDSTVVATAVPSIVKSLGGFALYPWLFSSYLLTQGALTPVFAKLSDSLGRRVILVVSTSIFLFGSILSGVATSIAMLIVFRGVQGVGASGIQPVTQTIVGDIYSIRERGKAQGLMSSVWGISAVVGPALGGFFAEYVGWRWIFYINLPIGLVALAMVTSHLPSDRSVRMAGITPRMNVLGATLLVVGSAIAIFTLLATGKQSLESGNVWTCLLLAGGIVVLVAFVLCERRASDPIFPLWLARSRALIAADMQGVVIGLLMVAVTAYIPIYAQTDLLVGPILAGFALAVMSIGWPVASASSARLYLRFGFRNTALLGSVFVLCAAALYAELGRHSLIWAVAGCSLVLGFGLGLQVTSLLVGIQSIVERSQRGVVTGSFVFARTTGMAIGAAGFAAVAHSASLSSSKAGIFAETHRVFLAMVVVAAAGVVLLYFAPREFARVTMQSQSQPQT